MLFNLNHNSILDGVPNHFFMVFAEKKLVLQCDSFISGLEYLCGLFYILNIKYPKPIAKLMEFVQRSCLKIHMNRSRAEKLTDTQKGKVMNLIEDLEAAA